METETREFSPPYNIPWKSFLNTVDRVIAEWPNKVDRSYLASQAGTVQTYLISAFKGFGLIDDDNRITPFFKGWDPDPATRPEQIAALLRTYYPTMVALGTTNATPAELSDAFAEAFPSVTGESRVKAMRFYLAAAEYAGLPRSSLWKAPRAAGSSGGARKPRGRKPNSTNGGGTPPPPPRHGSADMKQRYFDLLLKKAEASEEIDTDLLDRIERVAGIEGQPHGSKPEDPQ